jgi:hypothetical protein
MYHFARHNHNQTVETVSQPKLRRGFANIAAQALLALAIVGGALLPAASRAQTNRWLLAVECERTDGSGTAWVRTFVGEGPDARRCSQLSASYLQGVCTSGVHGQSTYKSCTTLVKNEYGQWVAAPESEQ